VPLVSMIIGTFFAIVLDLVAGYPGAGLPAVALHVPFQIVAWSSIDLVEILVAYTVCGFSYVLWSVSYYGVITGGLDGLWSSRGGSLGGIIAVFVAIGVPVLSIAGFVVYDEKRILSHSNSETERMFAAARATGRVHDALVAVLRGSMPKFAPALLAAELMGVETRAAIICARLQLIGDDVADLQESTRINVIDKAVRVLDLVTAKLSKA